MKIEMELTITELLQLKQAVEDWVAKNLSTGSGREIPTYKRNELQEFLGKFK